MVVCMRIQVFLLNSYLYSTQFLGLIMYLDIPLFHDPFFPKEDSFLLLGLPTKIGSSLALLLGQKKYMYEATRLEEPLHSYDEES